MRPGSFFIPYFHAIISAKAPVAQWIERSSPKAEVVGSTPAWGTLSCLTINFFTLVKYYTIGYYCKR